MNLDLSNYQQPQQQLIRQAYGLARASQWLNSMPLSPVSSLYNGLETAKVLLSWQLDAETVAASLMVPVVFYIKDTKALAAQTNQTVVELAQSVLRLAEFNSRLSRSPKLETTHKNTLKLLLAESRDMRTLIIWLATRLVVMRLQQNIEMKRLVATRTRDIYAPIAELLGMWNVKVEMEEFSFKILEPQRYKEIERAVRKHHKQIDHFLAESKHFIKKVLVDAGIDQVQVSGRVKNPYSIYRKLYKTGSIQDMYDLVAVRVIVGSVDDCYKALGLIHKHWEPIRGGIDDYIAHPKPNGYQSLHTTVKGSKKGHVEVQIRTQAMHEEAESGVASHFNYDSFKNTEAYRQGMSSKKGEPVRDITKLHDVLKNAEIVNPEKLVLSLYRDKLYVFTPKGDVVELPKNAAALDFAFAIHSDIGLKTKAVIVNGSISKLEASLKNGDIVEVQTFKLPRPHRRWLEFVRTEKARGRIKNWILRSKSN